MRTKIITILNDLRPEFNFNDNLNFIEEGMLDSFDIVSLVTTLDETFGISIDGVDIIPDNFSSIDNILDLLSKKGVK